MTNLTQAFVFPGQGSQSVGMQADLADAHPLVEQTYREGGQAIDTDLWLMTREGPKESLDMTVNTQPAMLCAGVAAWRVYKAAGGADPAFLAGHSLGEYSALVAAGVMDFPTAVRVVAERARCMQDAVAPDTGAMAVVLGLDDDAVRDACANATQGDELAQAVNYNAPGQVAIAGTRAGVDEAMRLAKEGGARRAMALPVSVPSHCDLMRPAAEAFATALDHADLQPPSIAVINNVDVAIESDPAAIRDALLRQLYRPVRWVETVGLLQQHGVVSIVECGPGKVLAGLTRRIDRALTGLSLDSQEALEKLISTAGDEA